MVETTKQQLIEHGQLAAGRQPLLLACEDATMRVAEDMDSRKRVDEVPKPIACLW